MLTLTLTLTLILALTLTLTLILTLLIHSGLPFQVNQRILQTFFSMSVTAIFTIRSCNNCFIFPFLKKNPLAPPDIQQLFLTIQCQHYLTYRGNFTQHLCMGHILSGSSPKLNSPSAKLSFLDLALYDMNEKDHLFQGYVFREQ